jgi:GNAT superfamily N-acetyltransferase
VSNRVDSPDISGITVHYLANHPAYADHLGCLSWQEWQHIYEKRGQTLDDARKSYRQRANLDRLPLALIACCGAELAGTVSLKEQDLEIRPDLTPWLGGLFVLPEWRGRGLASLLMRRAMAEAKPLRLNNLYLWTSSAESLYLKLGWKSLERTTYCGKEIVVMQTNLTAEKE